MPTVISPRALWRRLSGKSPRHLLQVTLRRLADRAGVGELDFPLHDRDVWDSTRPLRPAAGRAPGGARRIGWVVVPPTPGSGGHTTFFRMLAAAERAGHRNTLLLYDRYGGDTATHLDRLRRGWPWLDCEVRDIDDPLDDLDAVVASAWQTAHVMARRTAELPVERFALLQDYEPDFYARGSLRALAEDSYRFPVENIALGPMVAQRVADELGVACRVIPYGTDRTTYRLLAPASRRQGVVFFAKTGNDRRGYRLGVLALREFQRRAPEVPIDVYGDTMREPGLRVRNHGYLSPDALNELYNAAAAGLVLSFTNVSLVPAELAAAGAIPVMNDFDGARAVFDNPHASWAAPTPGSLAQALEAAVAGATSERAAGLAAWPTATWDDTAHALLDVIAPASVSQDVIS
ncbi:MULTISPECIES: glycosyltransferase family 1 protein [unclassified Microbacterium]|uniref:rhamnosyltransferase WsaF family glycosyltransferase n=1 Tax=unclassified Microbacterium TaxID=2609290 RepID=UPI003868C376